MVHKQKKGFIFVLSGASGSGKTTIAKKLIAKLQLNNRFVKSMSFTTRPRRTKERQNKDYIFVTRQQFKELVKSKKILEHIRYLGYDYGTSRESLDKALEKGLHVLLCVDKQGARFLKREYPQRTMTIYIQPPSLKTLRERISKRCKSTKNDEVAKRLKMATKELAYARFYDYCVVNDDLDVAVAKISVIIKDFLTREKGLVKVKEKRG